MMSEVSYPHERVIGRGTGDPQEEKEDIFVATSKPARTPYLLRQKSA
jgi:hypothetical protein